VDSRLILRWAALIALLAAAVYLCWRIIEPFVGVLLWAVVLSVVFSPAHQRIRARVASPAAAAAVSTLLVIVIILVPVTFITVAVVNEARALASSVGAHEGPWLDPGSPVAGAFLRWLGQYVDVDRVQSPEFLRTQLQTLSGTLAAGTLGIIGGVFSALLQMLLVMFTLFYLFRDGRHLSTALYALVPLEEHQTRAVVARTADVIAGSVYGKMTISLIQGALGFFIFWAVGLPSALLWSVVMFFLSMIPTIGGALVWVPAALYLTFAGTWGKAIVLVVWNVIVIGTIDNLLAPRLIGKRTSMHELVIFFGVLGGIQVFGVLGVVLGPVVIAITQAIIEIVRETSRSAEPSSTAISDL
jgi:predicted PurR-regulated permease PerM